MITLEYLRTFRIGEYATFDLTVSFLGIMLLAPLLSKLFRLFRLDIPFISWLFFTLPIAVATHMIVGQNTLMTKYLLDPTSHYHLKIMLVALLVIGATHVKIIHK